MGGLEVVMVLEKVVVVVMALVFGVVVQVAMVEVVDMAMKMVKEMGWMQGCRRGNGSVLEVVEVVTARVAEVEVGVIEILWWRQRRS